MQRKQGLVGPLVRELAQRPDHFRLQGDIVGVECLEQRQNNRHISVERAHFPKPSHGCSPEIEVVGVQHLHQCCDTLPVTDIAQRDRGCLGDFEIRPLEGSLQPRHRFR